MKITKKTIRENTITTKVNTGGFERVYSHTCQIKHAEIDEHYGILFALSARDTAVHAKFTHDVKIIGEATNKKEFINEVYDYLNNFY